MRVLLYAQPYMRGDDVVSLQTAIARFDPKQDPGSFVDGVFGPRTREALVAYQKANYLPSNGIATEDFQSRYVYKGVFQRPGPVIATPVPAGNAGAVANLTLKGALGVPGGGVRPGGAQILIGSAAPAGYLGFLKSPWVLAAAAGLAVVGVGFLVTRKGA